MAPISKFSCSDLATLLSYFTVELHVQPKATWFGPQKDDGREDRMIFTSNWLSTTKLAEDNAKTRGG